MFKTYKTDVPKEIKFFCDPCPTPKHASANSYTVFNHFCVDLFQWYFSFNCTCFHPVFYPSVLPSLFIPLPIEYLPLLNCSHHVTYYLTIPPKRMSAQQGQRMIEEVFHQTFMGQKSQSRNAFTILQVVQYFFF